MPHGLAVVELMNVNFMETLYAVRGKRQIIYSATNIRKTMCQEKVAAHLIFLCVFKKFVLEYSCFTVLPSFLLHGKVNCLYEYTYSGEGNGTPLQYSCLENPMDGGARWAAVHGVAKIWTRLSYFTFTFTFHFLALETEVATHSSVLGLENPRDGGAWWAAVSGVVQSQTRLKRLSSSSSRTHISSFLDFLPI